MALDFPSSPSVNDTYSSGGRTWRWDGTSWVGATPYSGPATITGGTINNTAIGGSTPAAGAFTTLSANSTITAAAASGYYLGGNLFALFASNKTNIYSGSSGTTIWDNTGANVQATFTTTGLAVTGSISATTMIKLGSTVNGSSGIQFDVSQSTAGVEWFGSPSGSGYGHRIIEDDSGAGYSRWKFQGRVNSASWTTVMQVDGTTGLAVTGGIVVGSATGGTIANGVNVAGDVYKNNTAYTNPDYVLEHWAKGKIEKFANKDGAKDYDGLRTLDDVEQFARTNLHLPRFGQDAGHGLFSGSDAILAALEEAYLYLFNQNAELKALRARVAQLESSC